MGLNLSVRCHARAAVRRCFATTVLAGLLLQTGASGAAGQADGQPPDRFLAVKAWRLTWTAQAEQSGGIRQGSVRANGEMLLTLDDEGEGAGIVDGVGTWTGRGTATGGGTYHEDRGGAGVHREGSGSVDASATLVVDPGQRTYDLSVACDDGVPASAYDWSPVRSRRTFTDSIGLPCPSVARQPLPGRGGALGGSRVHRVEADGLVVTTTWSLSPAGEEDYELLVEPIGDYDAWMPEGHLTDVPAEAPGASTMAFRARFQKVGGGAPAQKPSALIFDLLDVTREPGVCLNFPQGQTGPALPDLRFHEGDGRFTDVTEDGLHAEIEAPDALDVRVAIHSYDFAAYGQLRVKAVMAGGREIVGRFVPTGRDRIPVPRDDDGDRIADRWEAQHGVGDLAPETDDDARPAGQASAGDGIPLFDEYRGFVRLKGRTAERVHHRTDPNLKSVFVIDDEGLFRPEDWVDATGMESFRLSGDLVGRGTAGKPAARNATNVNRGAVRGPEYDYAIRLQTQGGTAGRLTQLGYAEIRPDVVDNPSYAEYVMVSPSRIRIWVERSLPRILEQQYATFRAGGGGTITDEATARLVLDAQRELLTNPAIVGLVADRLVAKTVVHEVAHASGMYHHGVDPAAMTADKEEATRGDRACPARYHEDTDFLTIAVVETLFPREGGMLLDSGRFCGRDGCWKKLKVRDW